MTEDEVIDLLRKVLAKEAQFRFAARARCSRPYVNQVLMRIASPGPKILEALGVEKVVTYRPENDVIELLRTTVAKETQVGFAARAGCAQPYVNRVLLGKQPPGPKILAALGIEKVVTYRIRRR